MRSQRERIDLKGSWRELLLGRIDKAEPSQYLVNLSVAVLGK